MSSAEQGRGRKMRRACIMLAVFVLAFFRIFTAVEGDTDSLVCLPDEEVFDVLTGRRLVQDACVDTEKNDSCCEKLQVPGCNTWRNVSCKKRALKSTGRVLYGAGRGGPACI